jgi:hypothetical protein
MIQAIHPTPTPKANPAAIIHEGDARFTILTSRLIRMEFDPQKRFEDHASQVFLYREQEVPSFNSWRQDGWLHIETDHLHLQFKEKDASTGATCTLRLNRLVKPGNTAIQTKAIWAVPSEL